MKEILLKVNNNILSLKTAGICLYNGKILLKKNKNSGIYSFPGGQIIFGETAENSLSNKFIEETDTAVHIESLKIVSENFYKIQDKPCHEICFYYKISPLDKQLFIKTKFVNFKNSDEFFEWISIKNISNTNYFPKNIFEILKNINAKELLHITG